MVGIGTLLALLAVGYLAILYRRKRLPESVWFYRALAIAGPLSVVALDRRLGHDRGRPPAVGRLRRDAHLPGGHRRERHPDRLRRARADLRGRRLAVVWILRRLAKVPLDLPDAPSPGPPGRTCRHHPTPLRRAPRPRGAERDAPVRRSRWSSCSPAWCCTRCSAGADFGAGFWQLTAGCGARGRADPRPRPPLDGAGVGGQPRVADLRLDRLLDGLPGGLRLDRLDPVRSRCSSPGSGSSFAASPTRCARVPRPRARRARSTRSSRSPRSSPRSRSARPIGGIASRRVPVGNAAGNLISSWLNPTSILIGVLAVATSAYLAAVYLAADAARLGEEELERRVPHARARRGRRGRRDRGGRPRRCCTPTPTRSTTGWSTAPACRR